MKCPYCGKEFTSEKIYEIHTQKCVKKQDEQSDDTEAKKQKEEKTTRKKGTSKRDET